MALPKTYQNYSNDIEEMCADIEMHTKLTDYLFETEEITWWSSKTREYLQFSCWLLKDAMWSIYFAELALPISVITLAVEIAIVTLDSP
eukprot:UN10911